MSTQLETAGDLAEPLRKRAKRSTGEGIQIGAGSPFWVDPKGAEADSHARADVAADVAADRRVADRGEPAGQSAGQPEQSEPREQAEPQAQAEPREQAGPPEQPEEGEEAPADANLTQSDDTHTTPASPSSPLPLPSSLHTDYDYSDNDIPVEISSEMEQFNKQFPLLAERYRLLDKIGEGTFSLVYKAEVVDAGMRARVASARWRLPRKGTPLVALKRIYVTSSPARIHNELMLLYMLTGLLRVALLMDIVRHQDQVVAVTPYYRHTDFRDFYRDLPIEGIRAYMFELLLALDFIHAKRVMHRDIKPTNFIYDPFRRKGVLLDFGLAEQQASAPPAKGCPCLSGGVSSDDPPPNFSLQGYPKDDTRPGRRANRAGTRGFRAPEVLFKCLNQTTAIDVWLAGVILLTLLLRRFPFFNSPDDVDALCELTTVFGVGRMKRCARLHGLGLETTVLHLAKCLGLLMAKLVRWCIDTEKRHHTLPKDSCALEVLEVVGSDNVVDTLTPTGLAYKHAFGLLDQCFEMDPRKRITARDALRHPFFESLSYLLPQHEQEVAAAEDEVVIE